MPAGIFHAKGSLPKQLARPIKREHGVPSVGRRRDIDLLIKDDRRGAPSAWQSCSPENIVYVPLYWVSATFGAAVVPWSAPARPVGFDLRRGKTSNAQKEKDRELA